MIIMAFQSVVIIFFLVVDVLGFFDVEEISDLKYGIEISQVPVLFSEHPGGDNILHISSKFGQLYQCVMPVRKIRDDATDKTQQSESLTNAKVIDQLDKMLGDLCIVYMKDWWTYKLCFKKKLEQYHATSSGDVSGEVMSLGIFESETDWNIFKREKKKDVLYHEHVYTNGSICDLTGKPRKSKVKFYCDEDALTAKILRIDEPESCTYEMKVVTSSLCEIPWFKPIKNNNKKDITCSPALQKKQYDDYLNEEKAKKQREKERRRKRVEDAIRSGSDLDDLSALKSIFDMEKASVDDTFSLGEFAKKTVDESKGETQDGDDGNSVSDDKDLSADKVLTNAMKGLMSAFNLKPKDMKLVSINQDGTKITFKGQQDEGDKNEDADNVGSESSEEINTERKEKEEHEKKETKEDPDSDVFVKAFLKGLDKGAKSFTDEMKKSEDRAFKDSLEPLSTDDPPETRDIRFDSHARKRKGESGEDDYAPKEAVRLEETPIDSEGKDLGKRKDHVLSESGETVAEGDSTKGEKNDGSKGQDASSGDKGRYVGNIRDIMKKAKARYSTLLDENEELDDRIAKSYDSTKRKVNRHLEHLQETMRVIKANELRMKQKNREETASNIVKKLKESMTTYQDKLRNLEKKMQDVRNLAKKNRHHFKEIFGDEDAGQNGDESSDVLLKALDKLKNNVASALESTQDEKNQADLSQSDEERGDIQNEKEAVQSEVKSGEKKDSLNEFLGRIGTMIKRKLKGDDEDVVTDDQNSDEASESKAGKKNGIKFRVRRLSKEAMDKLLNEDADASSTEEDADSLSSSSDTKNGRTKLKKATKKMEDMIRDKLRDSGIDLNGNVKVKIITDRKVLDNDDNSEEGMSYLTSGDASQFTSLLGGILGGHHEKVAEQRRQRVMESNYNFVWGGDQGSSNEEGTRDDEDSSDDLPFF